MLRATKRQRRGDGHSPNQVWAVSLDEYNKYAAVAPRPRLHSTHLSEQDATARAKAWWTTDTHAVENLTVTSGESDPYTANAIVEAGGRIMTVSVVRIGVSKLSESLLKNALELRGAPTVGVHRPAQ